MGHQVTHQYLQLHRGLDCTVGELHLHACLAVSVIETLALICSKDAESS